MKPAGSNSILRQSIQRGVAITIVAFLTSGLSFLLLYRQEMAVMKEDVSETIVQIAETAAALVDGDLHKTFTRPGQEHTPEYQQAVEPLTRVLHAHPEIRFLYTMILTNGMPHFILDATPRGDADKDGIEDHSPIMQPFETPAPALLSALTTGRAQADAEPIKDKWGTFLSGYAPFRDSSGRLAGIVGVDLKLESYAQRMSAVRRTLGLGTAIALGLSLLVGIGAGWLKHRAIQSEQQQAGIAEALRQTETNYRMLFGQMISGFALHEMLFTPDGKPADYRFLLVNPAFERMTGLRAQAIMGKTVKEVLPATEPFWIETYGQVVLTGSPAQFDHFSQALNRHYQVTAYSPARNQFACIFTDITEMKRMEEERRKGEEQLQHVQKLESLGLLAGGIAHDFNNLLMAILGNADLALEDIPPGSPVRPSLDQIKEITIRAADLCKQMLAYSGRGKFVVEPLDLSRLAGDMAKLLEVSISKHVIVRYNLARNLPAVKADASQLRQVIMNLVINASEAIGSKSGVVSLTTGEIDCDEAYLRSTYIAEQCQPGLYVFLEVSDTGCGMDKDTMAHLFDPFFTTKFTGRGLGLAATMGIVRGHHGALKVYSEPGKGSTFKVLLPAGKEQAVHGTSSTPPATWKGSGALLLVDDEETVRTVAKRMLERIGFTVVTANDGHEAVDYVRHHGNNLTCILMDLTMPHMGGEEAFHEISRLRTDIPVVLSSGYNPQEIEERLAGRGLAGFIQKPYQLATLMETLRNVTMRHAG